MKKILLILLLVIGNEVFSQNVVWHTDAKKAIDIALKQNKPVLFFFTGSDWCGWCKKLQRNVFDKTGFKTWANKKVVLLVLDFPTVNNQSKEIRGQNSFFRNKLRVQGFPSAYLIKPEKKPNNKNLNLSILGQRFGYAKNEVEWLKIANTFLKIQSPPKNSEKG